ncbi:MAG TPA: sigma-54 dependent transcriptional regulator [Chitinophagales bacterium]|nr:sigma-54 dependent transcriptional regulator [Chitinophagales bacterium]
MSRILVIDDDHDIVNLLKRFLTKHGYDVATASSGAEGEKLVDSFTPDLVMCDYRLDDMEGSVLLSKIKEKNPDLPVIIITGYSDLRTAVKVVRMGAFDYITKPFIPDEILLNISQALAPRTGGDAPAAKTRKNNSKSAYLFSNSPESKHLQSQIELVAPTNYSVVIYGESGAGKEGIARMIHDKSKRSDRPFVAMDCGAISRELAGSELFGHEKGSFTGAINQKVGHFELANGGTLFLDEIGNLPYDVQILLLRVIQEKIMKRIGGNKEIQTDVRIIVASNERLPEAIQKGKFREDLYHRLNEFSIEVPSLRNRKQDILFFANNFLRETSLELGKNISGFDPEVESVFLSYPWHGNLRELKNVIKRATLLTSGELVNVKSLPFEILNHKHLEFNVSESENMGYRTGAISSEPTKVENVPVFSKPQLKKAAMEAEYELILSALTKANFNKSKAAEILGIDRKTLYNKMKNMNLQDQ